LLKGRNFESRGQSSGTQVDVIQSEKGTRVPGRGFSHLRLDVTSQALHAA